MSRENDKNYFMNDYIRTQVNTYKKFKGNHRYTLYFWTIIAIIVLVIIVAWNLIKHPSWQTFLFVTDNGRFQWLGLSAAAAGIGLLINAIDNRRKLKADLISKSRIAWIAETKHLLSEFLSLSALCMSQKVTTKSYEMDYMYAKKKDKREFKQDYLKQMTLFNDLNMSLQTTRRSLIMSLSESDDNAIIAKKIEEIDSVRMTFIKQLYGIKNIDAYNVFMDNDSADKGIKKMESLIVEITPLGTAYFKSEWEKAKTGN